MEKDGITVNNVMLHEYLKDNEAVSEQVAREKLMSENSPVVKPYHKVRLRHKDHQETNGEVKILGEREKNEAIYEQELTRYIKSDKNKSVVVTLLVCGPLKRYAKPTEFSNELIRICKKYDIKTVDHVDSMVRWHLRGLLKTRFKEHLDVLGSRQKKYRIKRESLDTLSLQDALELAETPIGKNIKPKKDTPKPKPTDSTSKPELVSAPDPALTPEVKTENTREKIIDTVMAKVRGIGSDITVEGDLHIHIHVNIK